MVSIRNLLRKQSPEDFRYVTATSVEALLSLDLQREIDPNKVKTIEKKLQVLNKYVMDPIQRERTMRYLIEGR